MANRNPNGFEIGATPRQDTISKPKEFDGKRDAKELDNYLSYIERYFEALNIQNNMSRYTLLPFILLILQIRGGICTVSTWDEFKNDICTVSTWDEFKNELERQFY